MKRLVFVVGLLIIAAGVVVIALPALVIQLAQRSVTHLELYTFAAVRIGIGVLFLAAAASCRLPNVIRIVGIVAVAAGLLTPVLGVQGAQSIAAWWSGQALGLVRAAGLVPLAIGGLILLACGLPVQRAA